MHPVLGTMMPKICEAPHLPTSLFQPSFCSAFKEWDAFITFLPWSIVNKNGLYPCKNVHGDFPFC